MHVWLGSYIRTFFSILCQNTLPLVRYSILNTSAWLQKMFVAKCVNFMHRHFLVK